MSRIREHNVHLRDGPLYLRTMTENDWDLLVEWNSDPEVLFFSNDGDDKPWPLEQVHRVYRGISQTAFNFIIQLRNAPIGECWLQEMNLPRILERYPSQLDLRRIDLTIGQKQMWGKGWGTKVMGLLLEFGFQQERADAIFGCDIADANPRSRRAFEKNGFVIDAVIPWKPGRAFKEVYDMVCTRERYEQRTSGQPWSPDQR